MYNKKMVRLFRNFTSINGKVYLNVLLRWNCKSNLSDFSGENVTCPSEFNNIQTRVREVDLHGSEAFGIHWDDGVYSEYTLSEIERFALPNSVTNSKLFNSSVSFSGVDLMDFCVPFRRILATEKWGYWSDIAQNLDLFGMCIIDDVPSDNEKMSDILGVNIGISRTESHFGKKEILRVGNVENSHNKQLGYSSSQIPLHTDLPFYETPPRYQSLHCISPAEIGGENTIINARGIFEQIKEIYPEDVYSPLIQDDVTFTRRQETYTKSNISPIVSGDIIRFSPFTMDYSKLNLDLIISLNNFIKTCRVNAFTIKLRRNQVLLYDNWKCLHGRSEFVHPLSGKGRILIGTYYD